MLRVIRLALAVAVLLAVAVGLAWVLSQGDTPASWGAPTPYPSSCRQCVTLAPE